MGFLFLKGQKVKRIAFVCYTEKVYEIPSFICTRTHPLINIVYGRCHKGRVEYLGQGPYGVQSLKDLLFDLSRKGAPSPQSRRPGPGSRRPAGGSREPPGPGLRPRPTGPQGGGLEGWQGGAKLLGWRHGPAVAMPGELAQEEVGDRGSQQTRPRTSGEIRSGLSRVAGAGGQGPQDAGSRRDRTGRGGGGRG